MNRRDFLRQGSMLAAFGYFARSGLLGQTPSSTPAGSAPQSVPGAGFNEFRELRRNVGTFSGRGGTIGWFSSKAGVAVVDTQFRDTALMCLAGLPGRNDRKIDVVVNTHHHGDHTSGNGAFRPVSKSIVAHVNVPKLQIQAAERAIQNKAPSASPVEQPVLADTTFSDVWRHDFADEVMSAHYHGPAHTSGDAIILFEKANVVHMGDLVFHHMYPVIDRPAGASVRGWIKVLEEASKTYPADAIYIFGHANPALGPVGKRSDLLTMRDYWTAVLGLVEKEIASGKQKAEVGALRSVPGFADLPPNPGRLKTNLETAFDELSEAALKKS